MKNLFNSYYDSIISLRGKKGGDGGIYEYIPVTIFQLFLVLSNDVFKLKNLGKKLKTHVKTAPRKIRVL